MVRTTEFEEKVDKNGHPINSDGSLKYDPECGHCAGSESTESWEKEFPQLYTYSGSSPEAYEKLKSFISTLLEKARQEGHAQTISKIMNVLEKIQTEILLISSTK